MKITSGVFICAAAIAAEMKAIDEKEIRLQRSNLDEPNDERTFFSTDFHGIKLIKNVMKNAMTSNAYLLRPRNCFKTNLQMTNT